MHMGRSEGINEHLIRADLWVMLAPFFPGRLRVPSAICSEQAAALAVPPGLILLLGSCMQLFCSQCEQELEFSWCCKSTSTFGHRGTLGTDKVPVGVT